MRPAVFISVLIGLVPMANAQDTGSPSQGLFYAHRVCGACHAVAAGLKSTNAAAPTFEAIANTPGMTPMALNVWLHTSHPTMPNLLIDADRILDLAAYIGSLKKKPN